MTDPRPAPSTLELIDPVQEGAPRLIHPIGAPALHVGSPLVYEEHRPMDRPESYHIVEKSEVRPSRNGKTSMQFAEGTKVPIHVAYEYGLVGDPVIVSARPEGETTATANDDPVFIRDQGAAPENRMEPAPENRGYESIKAEEEAAANAAEDEDNLTPQQKAARTRAANKAAEEAQDTDEAPADEPAESGE
jgi:hypothetical protein